MEEEIKNRFTGTIATLDDAPFAFIFLVGVVDEQAIFNVSIVLP